jgi:hypothetical protein
MVPWFLLLSLLSQVCAYTWIDGDSTTPALCPGKYCGRTRLDQGNFSSCGACPRGYIVPNPIQSSECVQCTGTPELYDYLYLAFVFLFTLLSHWVAIDFAAKRNKLTKEIILVHISAFLETSVSAVLSLALATMKNAAKCDT